MSRLFDILHLKFPAPRIESKTCSLEETAGEQKTGLSTWSGWANWSFVVSETPIGGGARRFTAPPQGGQRAPLRGPGAQPRHAFGSFRRETKGTPGVGRVGPPMGAWGCTPTLGSAEGRSPSHRKVVCPGVGRVGPLVGAGAKSADLLRGAQRGPLGPPRKKTILIWNRSGRCHPQK